MENRSLSFTGADADGIAGEEGAGVVSLEETIEVQVEEEKEEGDKEGKEQEQEQEQEEEKLESIEVDQAEKMEIDTPSHQEIAAPEPSTPPPTDTPEPPPPQPQPPQPPLRTPPRDLRKIIEAVNIANPSLLGAGRVVPPSPVVKPGELHEFSADTTDPRARRRSSLNAGIAGLEELRNRTAAEGKDGMDLDMPLHGSLQDLVEATNLTDLDALMQAQQCSAHVIDAFVRLDFDDGQVFYVRNSSVIFGRAEGASSSSFQQIGPDGSTVIGNEPFAGFDPKTTPGAMSMKREKKKRRKKKAGEKSMAASAASSGSRRGSMVQRRDFPLFRETYERQQASGDDAIPVIHLPLNGSDAVPMPPRKNISRRHALLAYNFGKHRFEFKVTGKNGAFVDEEFVENGSTWIVPDAGMRIQIGGIGFKIVIPSSGQFGAGGFEGEGGAPPGRGKGKMSLAFTDEHGNEVKTDYDSEDEEDMVQMDEEEDGEIDSDESMERSEEEEEEEEGSGEEEEEEEVEDEEAEQGDAENEGESSSELSSSSDEEEEAPPPEPVKVEKKRGRGRPRKDESALSRVEADKARAKELTRQKEDRKKKEKAEAARRAKEADRERAAERKRLEREERQKQKDKQAREREREKERERREREQRKEQQKKLHLPQPKEEQPKKASKLYLPTPAAKKKDGEKSLTSGIAKKGPGRPPRAQQPELEKSPPQTLSDPTAAPVPAFASTTESASPQPPMPEPEQAFSPSNPLMAVAAFNATAPPIDPQLYNSAPNYTPPVSMHPHASTHQHSSPPRGHKQKEPKPKKEKPQPKKRTPSPELNEADYPPEALLKPAASYVILIHEAITNSGEPALTLPQIYKAIERKYPYFKLRVTTTGWQSSVRHNLGAHKAFNKVARSGKGWLWGINPGVSIEKEKNKASIAAQRPAAYHQQNQAGMPYPNGVNGNYQQPQVNGQYPQTPMYTPDNAQINGNHPQRPQYAQPIAAPQLPYAQPQQPARIPPMPMAYQPPAQPITAHTNGNVPTPRPAATAAPAQQFPNAPIPSPSGKLAAPPEVMAAIDVLKKQLALLTSSPATRDASGMDPRLVSQAQAVIQGLMSGRLKNTGVDVVKQLSKLLDVRVTALKQGGKSPQQTQTPVAASPPPPQPVTPTMTSTPVATQTPVKPVTPAKVDYKNLPMEKKQALYRALMLAKEKKEKEAREAAAAAGGSSTVTGSPGGGVKRPLENGGGEPVAKKVDVGGGAS